MTPSAEVKYLTGLLAESTRWTRDPDETKSSIELEICWRIDHLLPADNYDGAEVNGPDEIEVYPEMPKEKDKHSRYAETHVRVAGPDGKKKWHHIDDCVQVPVSTGGPGWKWVLKKEAQNV